MRFWYFMCEFGRHIEQQRASAEIEARTKGWKQYEKEWEKYFDGLPEEKKLPLWSKESWSYWFDKYAVCSYEEYCKRIKKRRKRKACMHAVVRGQLGLTGFVVTAKSASA